MSAGSGFLSGILRKLMTAGESGDGPCSSKTADGEAELSVFTEVLPIVPPELPPATPRPRQSAAIKRPLLRRKRTRAAAGGSPKKNFIAQKEEPMARSGHRVWTDGRYLYSIGGYNPENSRPADPDLSDSEEDPDDIVINAQGGRSALLREVWRLNLLTDSWQLMETKGNFPRQVASFALIPDLGVGRLVLFGGTAIPFGNTATNALHALQIYGPPSVLGQWVRLDAKTLGDHAGPLPGYGQGVVNWSENTVYVVGGTTGYEYNMHVHKLTFLRPPKPRRPFYAPAEEEEDAPSTSRGPAPRPALSAPASASASAFLPFSRPRATAGGDQSSSSSPRTDSSSDGTPLPPSSSSSDPDSTLASLAPMEESEGGGAGGEEEEGEAESESSLESNDSSDDVEVPVLNVIQLHPQPAVPEDVLEEREGRAEGSVRALWSYALEGPECPVRYRHEAARRGEDILVFGGGTRDAMYGFQELDAYSTVSKRWRKVRTLSEEADQSFPAPRRCHGLSEFQGDVYILGGFDGTDLFSDCWALNLERLSWRKLKASLPTGVYFHSIAITPEGCLYSFGGVLDAPGTRRSAQVFRLWLRPPALQWLATRSLLRAFPDIAFLTPQELHSLGIPKSYVQWMQNAD